MGVLLLAMAVILGAGYVTHRRPWWGLVLVALCLPFDFALELGLTVYTNELILLGITGGWLVQAVRTRTWPTRSLPVASAAGLFLLALLLSGLNAHSLPAVAKQVLHWLEMILIIWFAVQAAPDAQAVKRIIFIWLGVAVVISLLGVLQFIAGPQAGMNAGQELWALGQGRLMRAYGTFGQPNQFAGYLILIIPLALVLWPEARNWRQRALLGSGALILLLALVLSFSRGAWVGLAPAVAGLALIMVRNKKHLLIGFTAALGLLVLTASLPPLKPLRQAVLQRVSTVVNPGQDDSLNFRQVCLQTALAMFRQHPVIGFGAGEYDRNIRQYFDETYYAWPAINKHIHSLYLQILIEAGLLGLTGFLLMLGYYLYVLVRAFFRLSPGLSRSLLLGILASAAAFMIHNIFDVLTVYARGMHFGLALGLGLALARRASWTEA